MQKILIAPWLVLLAAGAAGNAAAAPPAYKTLACPVTLDGTPLGAALTPQGSSLRNTFAYEAGTRRYHFWGFASDDPNWPSAASSLRGVVHATSTDGLHFVSDSNLSYAFGSADYHDYGASIDPPLDFLRAVFNPLSGTWKLLAWVENVGASVGSYNYNTSISDLGTAASTTAVQHQGPLSSPLAGNHVGAFGLVDGQIYLRVDSAAGGNARFDYTDGLPPATGALIDEADLYAGTPYCWFLDSQCGTMADPRRPAYVHNVGRTLKKNDGSLSTYYSFRDAVTYARVDKQVWYIESVDGGATWSAPQGTFADGDALTIDGAPTAGDGYFGTVDAISSRNVSRLYFSTRDAQGNSIMVSATTGGADDTLFADDFDPPCG